MAESASAPAAADASIAREETTRPADAQTESAVVEPTPAVAGDVATTAKDTEDPESSANEKDTAAGASTELDAKADTTVTGDETSAPATATATTNGTPASKKNTNARRKSAANVPENKKKNTPRKKAAPELHLNVQPGEFWFVAMKGYPPWPVVICDEEMLPETLLSKRPVSAKRIDGTYREDFAEGGKSAKDRRYPVMFLSTNEFAWQVNTELQPLDLDHIKKEVENGNQGKKNKSLWDAYHIAAENHDLQWFKEMLEQHEKAMQEDAEKRAAAEAKKQDRKDKATKRKSTAVADDSEDVEMEDAGDAGTASAKKKGTKKRKKDAESDDEQEKPAKTPKIKLNNKGKDASTSKPKKETKPKKTKAKSESEEAIGPEKVEEKPMTEEERLEKREKSVLYLRHRLQKGFLSRDQAPKEEEMANMSNYLKQLEDHEDLEAEVIKKTKVHKVLKAIIKLNSIPKEEEYQFKKRSSELLNSWNRALAADGDTAAEASTEAKTNGVKHEEKKELEAAKSDTEKPADADGDVAMADAKDEAPVKTDAEPNAEAAATELETAAAA